MVSKVYLDSRYEQKGFIKSLGGRWDPNRDQWYLIDPSEEKMKKLNRYTKLIKGVLTTIEVDEIISYNEDNCIFVDE